MLRVSEPAGLDTHLCSEYWGGGGRLHMEFKP